MWMRQTSRGKTATIEAVINGKYSALEMLYREKANVDAQDGEKRTALMHAILNGDNKSVNIILAAKPDTSIVNEKGETALDMAKARCRKGNATMEAIVKSIEDYDRDVQKSRRVRAPSPTT